MINPDLSSSLIPFNFLAAFFNLNSKWSASASGQQLNLKILILRKQAKYLNSLTMGWRSVEELLSAKHSFRDPFPHNFLHTSSCTAASFLGPGEVCHFLRSESSVKTLEQVAEISSVQATA